MSLYATDSNGKLHKIAGNGIGDTIVVDAQLDPESTNPVQNKVITNALNKLIEDIPETDLSDYYTKGEVDNKIDNIPETDLSEYYTKSETVSEIVNNINVKFAESERIKSETDGAIVHENIIQGMAGVVLWSNPSPKTSFSSQTITLSSGISNFDYLMLEYEAYIPSNEVYNCRQYSYFKPIINGSAEFLSGGWDSGTRYIKARALKVVSETQIQVYTGWQEDAINDRMVVPLKIFGIKKGV